MNKVDEFPGGQCGQCRRHTDEGEPCWFCHPGAELCAWCQTWCDPTDGGDARMVGEFAHCGQPECEPTLCQRHGMPLLGDLCIICEDGDEEDEAMDEVVRRDNPPGNDGR